MEPDDILSATLKFAGKYEYSCFIVGERDQGCLVDLDPDRKEKAAELIKNFAKKHQVIFTTCSPETARLLGGNLIQI